MQNRPQNQRSGPSVQRLAAPRSGVPTTPNRPARPPVQGSAAPQRRTAPAPRRVGYVESPQSSTLNRAPGLLKPLIALAVVLAVGILLQTVILPNGWVMAEKPRATETVAEISSSRGVTIKEVMTANKTACFDEEGNTGDWIELYNGSNRPVDITGWVLTDHASRSIRFSFPEYTMQPGEYVLVFADGLHENGVEETWHAPFKLSSAGDTLMLFDAGGSVVQSMNIPPLGEDESYARDSAGQWKTTPEYTPLMENTTYNYAQLTSTQVVPGSPLVINEVMASNSSYPSPSGGLYDWIEIYNRGSAPIDLSGYGLSDNVQKPSRWRFPNVVIQPGACIVVYASGLDKNLDSGEMHLNFRLAAEGESVLLYSPTRQIGRAHV